MLTEPYHAPNSNYRVHLEDITEGKVLMKQNYPISARSTTNFKDLRSKRIELEELVILNKEQRVAAGRRGNRILNRKIKIIELRMMQVFDQIKKFMEADGRNVEAAEADAAINLLIQSQEEH